MPPLTNILVLFSNGNQEDLLNPLFKNEPLPVTMIASNENAKQSLKDCIPLNNRFRISNLPKKHNKKFLLLNQIE